MQCTSSRHCVCFGITISVSHTHKHAHTDPSPHPTRQRGRRTYLKGHSASNSDHNCSLLFIGNNTKRCFEQLEKGWICIWNESPRPTSRANYHNTYTESEQLYVLYCTQKHTSPYTKVCHAQHNYVDLFPSYPLPHTPRSQYIRPTLAALKCPYTEPVKLYDIRSHLFRW